MKFMKRVEEVLDTSLEIGGTVVSVSLLVVTGIIIGSVASNE